MPSPVALGGVDEATVADAPAAAPVDAGRIGRHEERLAATAAMAAEEPPAAERSGVVATEREPRVGGRVPTLKRSPVASIEVLEDVSDVERAAILDDVGVALGPPMEREMRDRHCDTRTLPR
jgi:hypothetical protein